MNVNRVRKSSLATIPLNTTDIPQSQLNIENKDRSNLFPWNGQFSPQFVEALLNAYSIPHAVVLDPFAGSGTVPYEAGHKGLRAFAGEINPAAYLMARTYQFVNVLPVQREPILTELDDALCRRFSTGLPLFSNQNGPQAEEEIKGTLVAVLAELNDPRAIELLQTLIVRLDFYQAGLNQDRVVAMWEKLRSLVSKLPYSPEPITVLNCDARALPLAAASVDLVITSPPYINVFNYHQQYRASTEALGWDLLTVAKSEFGSNRKHRGNRFLTVIQYCLDLTEALLRLAVVCKPSARVIFVVGRESSVRGTPFLNGDLVNRLGQRCAGFKVGTRQERVFQNKYGAQIYEDILHFTEPSRVKGEPMAEARVIAQEVLGDALATAASEVKGDIEAAIGRISQMYPSPLFDAQSVLQERAQSEQEEIVL